MASNEGTSRPARHTRIRRVRGRHLEIVDSSTSVSSHSFSPDELMPDAEVHRPLTTFVDRPSDDRRRVYHEAVPIEPPSPVKKACIAAPHRVPQEAHSERVSFDPLDGEDEGFYQMNLDADADDPPVPPLPNLGRKRKAIYSVRTSGLDRRSPTYLYLFFHRILHCIAGRKSRKTATSGSSCGWTVAATQRIVFALAAKFKASAPPTGVASAKAGFSSASNAQ
jgi:hypothetical protein